MPSETERDLRIAASPKALIGAVLRGGGTGKPQPEPEEVSDPEATPGVCEHLLEECLIALGRSPDLPESDKAMFRVPFAQFLGRHLCRECQAQQELH